MRFGDRFEFRAAGAEYSNPAVAVWRLDRPESGFAALGVGFVFAQASLKRQIIILAAVGVVVAAGYTKQLIPILLLGWIMSVTYNRQYYSFDGIYGDFGSEGLYWVPADLMFVVLAVCWIYHRAREEEPFFSFYPAAVWFTPFIIAAGLSALLGAELGAGLAELLRWIKIALFTVILAQFLRGRNWWYCIAAFACAVMAQSALGILQVGMNSSTGLLSMFGGGEATGNTIGVSLGNSFRTRASGTMVHPNIFAPYLLYLLPAFLALTLSARDQRMRVAAGAVCLIGYTGLVASMSRLPITIAIGQAGLVALMLIGYRRLSVKVAAGLASCATVLVLLVAAYFWEQIYERITGDFKQSLTFRSEYNDVAVAMWKDNPALGVGLNGFSDSLGRHDALLASVVEKMQGGRQEFGIRVIAPVHNLYLFVLAETGILGLGAFLFLLLGALYLGIRAVNQSQRHVQLVCIGLTAGLVGQYLQQFMDFSLWMDPGLITFATVMCLLYVAQRPEPVPEPFPVTGSERS